MHRWTASATGGASGAFCACMLRICAKTNYFSHYIYSHTWTASSAGGAASGTCSASMLAIWKGKQGSSCLVGGHWGSLGYLDELFVILYAPEITHTDCLLWYWSCFSIGNLFSIDACNLESRKQGSSCLVGEQQGGLCYLHNIHYTGHA